MSKMWCCIGRGAWRCYSVIFRFFGPAQEGGYAGVCDHENVFLVPAGGGGGAPRGAGGGGREGKRRRKIAAGIPTSREVLILVI